MTGQATALDVALWLLAAWLIVGASVGLALAAISIRDRITTAARRRELWQEIQTITRDQRTIR